LPGRTTKSARAMARNLGTDIYIQCRMAQVKARDDADNAAMMSTPVIVNNNVNTANDPPLYPKLEPITYGTRCTSRGC
jgi:hypothetical protein